MANSAFKLLVGTNNNILETFEEQTNTGEPKRMYVEGIFGEAGKKNKNGRIYDPTEMHTDIGRYNEEFVKTKRAFNELNHPSTPDVDLERACDRTVSLRMENDGTVYGKAVVLDTPMGRIQRALIDGGGMVGKSSRALGQIDENHGGEADYVRYMRIVCYDTVQDPSVSSAIVDPLLEQREWIIGSDGGFLAQPLDNLEESLVRLPRHDKEQYIVNAVLHCIRTM